MADKCHENRLYAVLYKIFAGLVRFIHNVRITGEENVPKSGALLVCPNHLSNYDVLIVAASLKTRQVRYFAKAELFKIPLLSQLIRALGAFPVKRGVGDVSAIKNTLSLLKDGEAVGFYPQGTRYPGVDPRNTEVKPGIGMIAYRSGAPILPICIQTKKYRVLPFRRVWVRIGKPIPVSELNIKDGVSSEFTSASRYVFSKITAMIKD